MSANKQTNDNVAGKSGPGRPKGSVNKVGAAAKDVIAKAAEELGGVDRLVAWAQEDPANERAFWATIYPKLIPLQVSADVEVTFPKIINVIAGRA